MLRKPLLTILVLIALSFTGWTRAEMQMTLDEPFSGFSSNDVGDIVYMDLPGGERIIWVGTARGISKTSDGGATCSAEIPQECGWSPNCLATCHWPAFTPTARSRITGCTAIPAY